MHLTLTLRFLQARHPFRLFVCGLLARSLSCCPSERTTACSPSRKRKALENFSKSPVRILKAIETTNQEMELWSLIFKILEGHVVSFVLYFQSSAQQSLRASIPTLRRNDDGPDRGPMILRFYSPVACLTRASGPQLRQLVYPFGNASPKRQNWAFQYLVLKG